MTIELITQEQYETVLKIQKEHPLLTYKAKGYDTPDESKFTEEDKKAFKEIDVLLEKHVMGFTEFQNFSVDSKGLTKFRFQYNWTADDEDDGRSFIGVGYLGIEELHKGFKYKLH